MQLSLFILQTAKGQHIDSSRLFVHGRRAYVQDYKHRGLSEMPMAMMKQMSKRRERSPLQLELLNLLKIIDELDMPSLYDTEF